MKETKTKTTNVIKNKADLIMRTSDLELLVKKLLSLKISEFTVKQSYRDLVGMNVIDFELDNFERITFTSSVETSDELVHMFYENLDGQFENLLEALRPLEE